MSFRAVNVSTAFGTEIASTRFVYEIYLKILEAGIGGSMLNRRNVVRQCKALVTNMKAQHMHYEEIKEHNSPSIDDIEKGIGCPPGQEVLMYR